MMLLAKIDCQVQVNFNSSTYHQSQVKTLLPTSFTNSYSCNGFSANLVLLTSSFNGSYPEHHSAQCNLCVYTWCVMQLVKMSITFIKETTWSFSHSRDNFPSLSRLGAKLVTLTCTSIISYKHRQKSFIV